MANYSYVINTSNYHPFTFDEKIKPYLLYSLDYDKLLEKLELYGNDFAGFTLPDEANLEYKDVINNFREKFSTAVDSFNNEGLGKARSKLLDVFRIAKSLIAPMQEAYKEYKEALKKVDSLGGDAIVGIRPDINNYLGGAYSPIKYLSRKDIMSHSAALASGVLENIKSEKGVELRKVIGDRYGQYARQVSLGNMTPEDAKYAISNEVLNSGTEVGLLLREVILNYKKSLNLEGYSLDALTQVDSAILTGMVSAIKDDSKLVSGEFGARIQNAQNTRALAAEDRLKALWDATYYIDGDGNLLFNEETPFGRAAKRQAELKVALPGAPVDVEVTKADGETKETKHYQLVKKGTDYWALEIDDFGNPIEGSDWQYVESLGEEIKNQLLRAAGGSRVPPDKGGNKWTAQLLLEKYGFAGNNQSIGAADPVDQIVENAAAR